MAMRYVVTDDFVAAHGWSADKTAEALMEPLARIGVLVERARGFGQGGFQSPALPPDAYRLKNADVIRIVRQVLAAQPSAGPIGNPPGSDPSRPSPHSSATRTTF